jgi:hypothetical protein
MVKGSNKGDVLVFLRFSNPRGMAHSDQREMREKRERQERQLLLQAGCPFSLFSPV